ncbi:hypothetical protein J2Z19_001788 [Ensifer adhaerens]|uniref:Uncharacterized protein n=1 Tax=Ensifer adhaerens TaxID=106592 RepID=A0ACC5ST63_ENSAD|nr:hypothetical protein [Ensifer adhaerens]
MLRDFALNVRIDHRSHGGSVLALFDHAKEPEPEYANEKA